MNLGDDADTTGAVCGQLAGAYFGVDGIRPEWLEGLAKRDWIRGIIAAAGIMAAPGLIVKGELIVTREAGRRGGRDDQ